MMKLISLIGITLCLLIVFNSYGQTSVNISNKPITLSANQEILYYDSGGANGNYANNESFTQTFTAPAGYKLYIIFESFVTESSEDCNNYDYMRVYDGANTSSPALIGRGQNACTNNDLYTNVYYRTTGNKLTVNWHSDTDPNAAGWKARIGCRQQNEITCGVKEYGVLSGGSANGFNSTIYSNGNTEYKNKYGKISYFFTPSVSGLYKITGKEGNGVLDQGDPEFVVVYNNINYFLNGDGGTAVFDFNLNAGTTYEIFITHCSTSANSQYNLWVEANFNTYTAFNAYSGATSINYNCTNPSANVVQTIKTASNPSGGAITYTSSNPAIASVNATTGQITAHSLGTVTITATSQATGCFASSSATYNFTVNAPTLTAPTTDAATKYSCSGAPTNLVAATNGNANTFWLSTSNIKEITCNSANVFNNQNATTIGTETENGRTYTKLTATADDPFAWFSNWETLDATENPFIHFTYKVVGWNGVSPNTKCQLYWTTPTQAASESRRSNIPIIADGEWHTQIINVNDGDLGGEQWHGTITGLRFDAFIGELANFQNAYILLDHISFRDAKFGATAEVAGSKAPITYMVFNRCDNSFDSYGGSETTQINKAINPEINFSISPENALECYNTAGQQVQITANPINAETWGSSPNFAWSAIGTVGTPSNSIYSVTPSATNNIYTVTVTNSTTKCKATKQVEIQSILAENITANGHTVCIGNPLSLNANSELELNYNWFTNNACSGESLSSSANFDITPTEDITYYVKATKTSNATCSAVKPIEITVVKPNLSLEIAKDDYLWTGSSSANWDNASNWLKYDGSKYVSTTTPNAANNVFVMQYNNDANNCISNFPTANVAVNVNNLTIGTNAILNADANTIDIGGDFKNNGTFNEGTSTIVFNGAYNQTIDGSSPVSFNNLTVNKASGNLILSSETNIKEVATFKSGKVVGDLIFAQNANAISNENSYLIGKVTKLGKNAMTATAFTFPVGSAELYAPLTAKVTPEEAKVSVSYYFAPAPANEDEDYVPVSGPVTWNLGYNYESGISNVSDRENWKFENLSADSKDAVIKDLRLGWYGGQANHIAHDYNGPEYTFAQLQENLAIGYAYYNSTDTSKWMIFSGELQPIVGNINEGYIQVNGSLTIPSNYSNTREAKEENVTVVTLMSADDNLILPITLLAFDGECNGESAELFWATASEKNNEWFVIEKSADATNFIEIARIAGAGSSIEEQHYSYTDANVLGGNNYYRLRQVDYDGMSTTSDIISLNCADDTNIAQPTITAYPNPFKDDITIVIANMDEEYSLEIYNELGQLVNNHTDYRTVSHELHLSDLPNGTYFVRVTSANSVLVEKIVKQ